ncbi:hypothetical protein NL676_005605 [Syzygium grande]|nr:hypothetical protein NL676_005605 [Syzygium grande]
MDTKIGSSGVIAVVVPRPPSLVAAEGKPRPDTGGLELVMMRRRAQADGELGQGHHLPTHPPHATVQPT